MCIISLNCIKIVLKLCYNSLEKNIKIAFKLGYNWFSEYGVGTSLYMCMYTHVHDVHVLVHTKEHYYMYMYLSYW